MTEVVRLSLLSHGMTDAMAATRFPADEPLNSIGRRQVEAVADEFGCTSRYFAGPEQRTRQTAVLLGVEAATEAVLADLDCGRWRGRALGDVPADDMTIWLTDPASAPHGGESITELIARVAQWLESLTANPVRTVAVTHPAVIRAAIIVALDAAPASFWRIDVAPAGRVAMHCRSGRWTLRV